MIERNATSGFDFLDTPSCQVHKAIIEDNTTEVIMHMQVACSTSILLRSTDEPIAKHL